MRLQLDDVALFTRIAELGTLSAAARERNVPVSQVTRSLSRLESACGARLIHRNTHGLSLTEEGHTMLAYGRRVLHATVELGGELADRISGPSGWVRVSVSLVIAESVIAPSLDGLYRRHPNLHVELRADDRLADMARDGIDIAVRTGELASETLVARRIGGFGRTVVASPAYLQRFGTPRKVAELDAPGLKVPAIPPYNNLDEVTQISLNAMYAGAVDPQPALGGSSSTSASRASTSASGIGSSMWMAMGSTTSSQNHRSAISVITATSALARRRASSLRPTR